MSNASPEPVSGAIVSFSPGRTRTLLGVYAQHLNVTLASVARAGGARAANASSASKQDRSITLEDATAAIFLPG